MESVEEEGESSWVFKENVWIAFKVRASKLDVTGVHFFPK